MLLLGRITSGVGNKLIVLLSNDLNTKLSLKFFKKILFSPAFFKPYKNEKKSNIGIGKITDIIGCIDNPYVIVTLKSSLFKYNSVKRMSKDELVNKKLYTYIRPPKPF